MTTAPRLLQQTESISEQVVEEINSKSMETSDGLDLYLESNGVEFVLLGSWEVGGWSCDGDGVNMPVGLQFNNPSVSLCDIKSVNDDGREYFFTSQEVDQIEVLINSHL